MYIKLSFFDVMSEVQKDSEGVSAGNGIFNLNPVNKNFVWSLTY
jgi:hypothetical protein